MTRTLGIDPGQHGGLALYDPSKTVRSGLRWVISDLPGDTHQLRDWLRRYAPDHAFLEHVTPMRGWGVSSSWKLSGSFHSVLATLQCCDVPTLPIAPSAWKRHHDLLKTDKEAGRQKALDLFPELREPLARKRDHGRADAVLIAAFGSYKLGELL